MAIRCKECGVVQEIIDSKYPPNRCYGCSSKEIEIVEDNKN